MIDQLMSQMPKGMTFRPMTGRKGRESAQDDKRIRRGKFSFSRSR